MVGILVPSLSKTIFDNLGVLPEWYTSSCITLIFTIFGISVGAPIVSNIFSGLGSFVSARRDYKLQAKEIDHRAFFEKYRLMAGAIDQTTVERLEKALKESEK